MPDDPRLEAVARALAREDAGRQRGAVTDDIAGLLREGPEARWRDFLGEAAKFLAAFDAAAGATDTARQRMTRPDGRGEG